MRRSLAGLAVAGCVAVAGWSTPASAKVGAVPFVERPLPSVLPQQMTLPVPPVESPPCRVENLATESRVGQGAGQRAIRTVRFTNTSADVCSLSGRPRMTATLVGEPVVEAGTGRTFIYDPYPPRDLAPGDEALLAVEANYYCDAAMDRAGPRRLADGVVFHLETGDLAVPLTLDVTCGVGVTKFGVSRGPDMTFPDIERMTVRARFPATARAGEAMTFVVQLTNPSPTPVSLSPCPGFRINFSGPGIVKFDAPELGLNCDTVDTIGPGQTVSYDMSVPVPTRLAGEATVSWSLVPIGEQDIGQVWVFGSLAEECLAPVFARPPIGRIASMAVEPDGLLANGLFLSEALEIADLSPDDPEAQVYREAVLERGRIRKDALNPTRCSLWIHL